MSVNYHFYGTSWNDPTIGDLLHFLRELGLALRARMPSLIPSQTSTADTSAPLVGQGLYLVDEARSEGAISLATQPIDRQHRNFWKSIRGEDTPTARELSTVASLTAYDAPSSDHYASLTEPVLIALGELFPPGYIVRPEEREAVSTTHLKNRLSAPEPYPRRALARTVETPVVVISEPKSASTAPVLAESTMTPTSGPELYGLWGRYIIDRTRRDKVRALLQGTPVLSHLAQLTGNAVTIEGRGVSLSDEEWASVYSAILECAGQASGGFVQVRCRDRFDTRLPARG